VGAKDLGREEQDRLKFEPPNKALHLTGAADATEATTTETKTRATSACPRCGAAMIVGPILSALQLVTAPFAYDTS
jgi:hypothetical protein